MFTNCPNCDEIDSLEINGENIICSQCGCVIYDVEYDNDFRNPEDIYEYILYSDKED